MTSLRLQMIDDLRARVATFDVDAANANVVAPEPTGAPKEDGQDADESQDEGAQESPTQKGGIGRWIEKLVVEESINQAKMLKTLLHELETYIPRFGNPASFFDHVRFLDPTVVMDHEDAIPDAKAMSTSLNVPIPAAKWLAYLSHAKAHMATPEEVRNPTLFWEKAQLTWPGLSAAAIAALWVPVTVTGCDTAISVEGNLFSSRQSRLAPETAGGLLQIRLNGDVFARVPEVHSSFCQPDKKP